MQRVGAEPLPAFPRSRVLQLARALRLGDGVPRAPRGCRNLLGSCAREAEHPWVPAWRVRIRGL